MSISFNEFVDQVQPVYRGLDKDGDNVRIKFLNGESKTVDGFAKVKPYKVPSWDKNDLHFCKFEFLNNVLFFVEDKDEENTWLKLRVSDDFQSLSIIDLISNKILGTLHMNRADSLSKFIKFNQPVYAGKDDDGSKVKVKLLEAETVLNFGRAYITPYKNPNPNTYAHFETDDNILNFSNRYSEQDWLKLRISDDFQSLEIITLVSGKVFGTLNRTDGHAHRHIK